MAAGRGSRMKGFQGNKTLLPLLQGDSPFHGTHPILLHILDNLPSGPTAVVIHHEKDQVKAASNFLGLTYIEQPVLNGTGGALLAAKDFLGQGGYDSLIITMGDVPFVKDTTYRNLVAALKEHPLVVLGFQPKDKKQYGVLEISRNLVKRITEWKYWSNYPKGDQERLDICNSGIYAVRRNELLTYLDALAHRGHRVTKEKDGKEYEFQEFFITDLVEMMSEDGHNVGYALAKDEEEVMGIDDLPSLLKAQGIFKDTNPKR